MSENILYFPKNYFISCFKKFIFLISWDSYFTRFQSLYSDCKYDMLITYSMLSVSSKYFLISFYFFSFMGRSYIIPYISTLLQHTQCQGKFICSALKEEMGRIFFWFTLTLRMYLFWLPYYWGRVGSSVILSLSRPLDIKLVFCLFV